MHINFLLHMRLAVAAWRLKLGARLSFFFRMIFRIILNCISYNQQRHPDQGSQRCWSKYRRYPFRSLIRSREMLIGKICTPNLVSLAGPIQLPGFTSSLGPANNDQSLCYVGGRTHSSFVAIPIWIATYVIVFISTVNND